MSWSALVAVKALHQQSRISEVGVDRTLSINAAVPFIGGCISFMSTPFTNQ